MQRVVVSASFDHLRSPQVCLLEAAAQLGEVQVALWSDETVRAITGEAPKFPQAERAYCEANRLGYHVVAADTLAGFPKPDLYAVNEDGDKSAKKEYCERHGIGYVVLKRTPKEGLVRRSSTDLR